MTVANIRVTDKNVTKPADLDENWRLMAAWECQEGEQSATWAIYRKETRGRNEDNAACLLYSWIMWPDLPRKSAAYRIESEMHGAKTARVFPDEQPSQEARQSACVESAAQEVVAAMARQATIDIKERWRQTARMEINRDRLNRALAKALDAAL